MLLNHKKILNCSHLFLVPIFLILFLLSHNINEGIPATSAIIAYFLLQSIWLLTFLFILFFNKNYISSSTVSTLTLFLFFSFDLLLLLLKSEISAILVWAILQIIITFLFTKKKLENTVLSQTISFVSAFLCILNIYNYYIALAPDTINHKNDNLKLESTECNRSIYHIYLDGMAREDILKELYHVDIDDITNKLHNLGFYIANKSLANYCQTVLSMCSTLNMDYLQDFFKEKKVSFQGASRYITDSIAFNKLKKYQYQIVTVDNDYPFIDLETNADFYHRTARKTAPSRSIYTYTRIILEKSVLYYCFPPEAVSSVMQDPGKHQDHILNTFYLLKNFPKYQQKTFYFIHIVCPHPPFIFSENGKPVVDTMSSLGMTDGSKYTRMDPQKIAHYKTLYAKQAQYVLKEIVNAIDSIINKSKIKPIIILQADHGPGSETDFESIQNTNLNERMSIFNAYYFPDVDQNLLYETITPVNSYRILFNLYFNENYPLLKDKSYFSTLVHRFKFYNLESYNGKIKLQ